MKSIANLIALNFEVKYESPLEKRVAQYLLDYQNLNWKINFPVGRCRIDIAFPDYKIGLEIDGEKYHKNKERDKRRDEYLKTLGWKIERVPGFFAYRYPEAALVAALRNIPDVHDQPAYKHGVAKLLEWSIRTAP